jgi:triacylglycerol lipase
MRETIRVYLVPGFFGFTNFGELKYFAHVKEALEHAFAERGVKAFVERVKTSPTASLPVRTGMLLHEIAATARDDELPIHLVGHSTGGLDARLLLGPAFAADADDDGKALVARVRSVLCVATPHYGSPLAAFFDGAFGAQLLKLLSLATMLVLRTGKIPVGALTLLAGVVTTIDDVLGAKPDVLDQLYDLLLADFSLDRRRELERHFLAVGKDRALIAQLAPQAMDVFNATTPDKAGVRYGCVATQS